MAFLTRFVACFSHNCIAYPYKKKNRFGNRTIDPIRLSAVQNGALLFKKLSVVLIWRCIFPSFSWRISDGAFLWSFNFGTIILCSFTSLLEIMGIIGTMRIVHFSFAVKLVWDICTEKKKQKKTTTTTTNKTSKNKTHVILTNGITYILHRVR